MPIYIVMVILTVVFGVLAQGISREAVVIGAKEQRILKSFNDNTNANNVFVFMILIILVFVSGLQSGFGDTTSYLSQFKNLKYSFPEGLDGIWMEKSPLFQIYMAVIKWLTNDGQWFLLITAFISNFLVWQVMRKVTYSIPIACYLYICSNLFLWSMNGIRQYLAVTILFASYKLIIKGKWKSWFLLLFILFFVHSSVFFLIPVYFIFRSKPWTKATIALIGIVLLIGVFYSQFTNVFFDVADGTTFEEYKFQLDEVARTKIIRTIFMAIPAILCFIYRKRIEQENSLLLSMSANASVLSASIYFLASIGAGNLIGRLAVFSDLFVYIILMPYLIKKMLYSKDYVYAWLYQIAVGVFYWYQMYIVYSGVWWSKWLGWYFV